LLNLPILSKTEMILFVFLSGLVAATTSCAMTGDDPLSLVDPLIGSGGEGFGAGGLNPGPQVPFGSMRLGPDTEWLGFDRDADEHTGGYHYKDTSIVAFSHTHLVGGGVPDYGNIGVMAHTGKQFTADLLQDQRYRSAFSHANEVAQPGYYSRIHPKCPEVL